LLLIVPFSNSFTQLWDQVITFHTTAKAYGASTIGSNFHTLVQALVSPLGVFALYGTLVSLLRKDWRVLPLIAWFLAVFYLLWQQVPLFAHHLVTLDPPLVLLATAGLGPLPSLDKHSRLWIYGRDILVLIGVCVTVMSGLLQIWGGYQHVLQQANGADTKMSLQVVRDLDAVTQPDQLVITDAQFLVAKANRSTPPQLVDTSFVRIQSGYLSNAQLIEISRPSSVHTVLFYTGRLGEMRGFYLWVSQHFRKVQDYGNGRELWSKIQ
jgi:hypothetical protein